MYAIRNVFVLPDMTLTLSQETLYKVITHPLTKGTLLVKYEPDLTKVREYMIWTRIFQMILL